MSELWEPVKDTVTVRAPAKINLCLGVGPVRADGFHPLDTIYQAIGLYDDVTVATDEEWIVELESASGIDLSEVPTDESNLVVRAGKLLQAHHGLAESGARITIEKGIPVAGGLAGGSADAAATLVALDRLWGLETSDDDILRIAADLGSDVPFALIGGTARGTGRGELVEPVEDTGSYWWVVVPNAEGLSTPSVYAEFDRGADASTLGDHDDLLAALAAGSVDALGRALVNDLTPAAFRLRPELAGHRDRLAATSAVATLLSGSGPSLLALAEDGDRARRIIEELADAGFPQAVAAPGPVAGAHEVTYA
ncbi:MAG: 4-(cytidine 5'-diphospho)-2-C-methyl-D-erythritol kinase [Myxococcales bacterium]|nr:MAG: 4-(cytidine 5'-diphospho)-2-C-methyl-D-erythritol kinase [Myxococcales bacterium]